MPVRIASVGSALVVGVYGVFLQFFFFDPPDSPEFELWWRLGVLFLASVAVGMAIAEWWAVGLAFLPTALAVVNEPTGGEPPAWVIVLFWWGPLLAAAIGVGVLGTRSFRSSASGVRGGSSKRVRLTAFGASLAALASIPCWLVVGVIGLGALSHSPEQGGCWQPQIAYGVALLGLASLGLIASGWTLYRAVQTVGSGGTTPVFYGESGSCCSWPAQSSWLWCPSIPKASLARVDDELGYWSGGPELEVVTT